jgi:hypothetical protein
MWMLVMAFCGCASGPNWKRQVFAFSIPGDRPTTNASEKITGLSRVSISPLFQSRSFTYRTGDNAYEQDPYAAFLIPPERALAESMRGWMRASGVFGTVAEPGSGFKATVVLEAFIDVLYGDFRKPSQPVGTMGIHVVCYQVQDGVLRRLVLDTYCSHETPLAKKTPAALMAAWDTDLREIMDEINTQYVKTKSNSQ